MTLRYRGHAFIYLEPVQRYEDRCDMRRFSSFNHSACKTVLNLLEAVYLRLRKIVVERVTVVKFRVDNRGSNGTGCFNNNRRVVNWMWVNTTLHHAVSLRQHGVLVSKSNTVCLLSR